MGIVMGGIAPLFRFKHRRIPAEADDPFRWSLFGLAA
jgi:hypothetical protein